MTNAKTNRTVGRPAPNTSRVKDTEQRPTRTAVADWRNVLTVEGKDPNFHYRWIMDKDEAGQRIYRFTQAGYELVQADTHKVGDNFVYSSDRTEGSLLRVPADKEGNFLYLVRIKQEWYQEDQQAKQLKILSAEKDALEQYKGTEGTYGEISRKL